MVLEKQTQNAFKMYLTAAELSSHLYPEVQQEIARSTTDTTLAESAIKAAIEEASSYLTHYDVAAVFNATGANRNAIILMYVKDIAVWHFINLSNAAVEWEMRESRYKLAKKFLMDVQKGDASPNLPLVTNNGELGDGYKKDVRFGGNPRRGNRPGNY